MTQLSCLELEHRAKQAFHIAESCTLCPRKCNVNRLDGKSGYCGAGADIKLARALPHFGEEPPLSTGGAGTLFFSHCNLRCVYCQNHQISTGRIGETVSTASLAKRMLDLQQQGCWNIEPVSPSHFLPWFLEALAIAAQEGLRLPVVYNTNGYESEETLDLLDGIVDIYLPDLKYSDNNAAIHYSDANNYVSTARIAIQKMYGQVGNLRIDDSGRATTGIILRHLILPNGVSGTRETLMWIAEHLPLDVTLSIMAQYSPLYKAHDYPELSMRISEREYEDLIDLTWDLGFENAFIQDFAAQECGIPDFSQDEPFTWS